MEVTLNVRDANFKKQYLKEYGLQSFIQFYFQHYHGYPCSLTNPQSLSEKIQWLKLHAKLEKYACFVDKYEVRSFIKETIGDEYLIPLLGVYSTVEEINFAQFPNQFILKATHGSGWNELVLDKKMLDIERIREKGQQWLDTNYFEISGEPNYLPMNGRLIVEENIAEEDKDLKDYKFFCFKGEPIFIQVDSQRAESHKRNIFNVDWEPLEFQLLYPKLEEPILKPTMLNEMLLIAKDLSKNFLFVRVDLYQSSSKVYFGELTFTPGSGFVCFNPVEYDYFLWIDGRSVSLLKMPS